MPVTYKSTRGGEKGISFREVVFNGLAKDGGLFIPEYIPKLPVEDILKMRSLSFVDMSFEIISQYISTEDVPHHILKSLLEKSFGSFRAPEVTPCVRVDDFWLLELFHGPTLAFKDVAMQFLGNLFEYLLFTASENEPKFLTVLGATSGDTGSAAIHGLRGKRGINCFILYPRGKVTELQERQMITVRDANIFCIAQEGDFDCAQSTVKAAFADAKFRREVNLAAVNSINWARVLVQMTYYFYAWLRMTDGVKDCTAETPTPVNFSVPTGNFGNVLAGYYAKTMGLPVGKLAVCTNENNVLHKFFETGMYIRQPSQPTLAPSMDISISSNFERYLYYLADENSSVLASWMRIFESTGNLSVPYRTLHRARDDFCSHASNREEIITTMRMVYEKERCLLCPHTATAVAGMKVLDLDPSTTVCLATAHPAKFEDAVSLALQNLLPPLTPPELAELRDLPTSTHSVYPSLSSLKGFIRGRINKDSMALYYISMATATALVLGMFLLSRRSSGA